MAENQSDADALRRKLNLETARIAWAELARHFARGSVLVVHPELDLVDVAVRIAQDDKRAVQAWTGGGRLARAGDADARRWVRTEPELWAVVVAPWVLVQESPRQRSVAKPAEPSGG